MEEKKIIITGKSGSGKNYLINRLLNYFPNILVKQTTRPIRNGEKDGFDYTFIDEKLFLNRIENDEFLSYQKFNIKENTIWYYGISKEDFNRSNLCILTPGEISILKQKDLLNKCYIIFLDMDREILEQRLNRRKDNNDNIKRRLDSDDLDFKDFSDFNLKISNQFYKIEDILKSISSISSII